MERRLHEEPAFDAAAFGDTLDGWKGRGASKILLEWSSGTGPTVFYYPAGDRKLGIKWTVPVETTHYNEAYADFVEHTLIPRMRAAIKQRSLDVGVMCVDLQPLQVQRQRRRQIERAQAAAGTH